uniref:Transcription factor IIS-like protein n=1 Tax=Siphoviridae sp. ct8LX107 TaxID=2826169 RepID=A0A8S5QR02_9CAUD|nr:MAG TPA: transcription factor IIS-like protein [Siphoviridae sp. ct8LX107]
MKTPDEIKKALKCHRDGRACHDCPYEQGRTFSVDGVTFGCSKDIVADALAYIERLEAKMEERTMSETPKCPYCGDRMAIHVLPHTTEQEFFSAWYQCVTCESTSPRLEFIGNTSQTKIEERLQAVSSRRAEPKNRVLTLEEVAKSEVMWYDDRLRTRARVVILGWGRCEPDFTKLVDRCGDEFYRKNASYNDFWRCWLRKPTEAERRETPWAGDSHE